MGPIGSLLSALLMIGSVLVALKADFFLEPSFAPSSYRIPKHGFHKERGRNYLYTRRIMLSTHSTLRHLEQLKGAEAFAVDSITGTIFTGTAEGKIWAIKNGTLETIPIFRRNNKLTEKPQWGTIDDELNGRILGLIKFHPVPQSRFSFDPSTNNAARVILGGAGQPLSFCNSIANFGGRIYVTDSASRPWKELRFELLEGRPSGRLLSIKPDGTDLQVYKKKLMFANGVVPTTDGTGLLVAETLTATIWHFTPDNNSSSTPSISREESWRILTVLPFLPDNLQRAPDGGYIVTGTHWRSPLWDRLMSRHPVLRRLIAALPPTWNEKFITKEGGFSAKLGQDGSIQYVVKSELNHASDRFLLSPRESLWGSYDARDPLYLTTLVSTHEENYH